MINNKINISLNKELRKKYGVRNFPVVKGDIVTIKSGSRKGEGGKVIGVNHKNKKISIEGITIAKADGKQVEFYVDHSNIVITKLDLSRPGRENKLREITARKNLPPPVVETEEEPKSSVGEYIEESVENQDESEKNLDESEDIKENSDEEEIENSSENESKDEKGDDSED